MAKPDPRVALRIFAEGTAVDRAVERAARVAIRVHKRGGVPLAIWEDGQVKLIPPEELPDLPPEDPPPEEDAKEGTSYPAQ